MSSLLKSIRKLVIVGFFVISAIVAATSFGLFGCTCMAEQTQRDPPVYPQRTEPAWSTSQGTK